MVLPNYPLIYYPDSIEKYFGKAKSDSKKVRRATSPDYQTIEPPQQPIFLLPIAKLVRVAGWIFSGLVGASLVNSLLEGAAWSFLLPAILALTIKTLLVKGLIYYINKFDNVQKQVYQNQKKVYWQMNRRLNQNLSEQTYLDLAQEFRAANPQLRINKNSSRGQHVLTRGEYREEAQKGVSEDHFLKYLQQYFYDCEITCDYFALNSEIGYTSDFSLVFSQYGIDIEIDEPYAGKSKKPHHCQDDSRDRNRNAYFLERGWIVARFSEHQAVFHPESCCREIAKIIERLGESKYMSAFSTIVDLPADSCWTRSSATAMAARKYRELYLDRAGLFTFNTEQKKPKPKKQLKTATKLSRSKKRSPTPKYKSKLRKKSS